MQDREVLRRDRLADLEARIDQLLQDLRASDGHGCPALRTALEQAWTELHAMVVHDHPPEPGRFPEIHVG